MTTNLLWIARAGGLDGYLVSNGSFYQTDYTRPLLFMGDGSYLASLAEEQHLLGNQWGMMNETGSYPGRRGSGSTPCGTRSRPTMARPTRTCWVLTVGVLSLALVLIPFILVVRDIPRWLPVHWLIWRSYYAEESAASNTGPAVPTTRGPGVAGGE